MDHLIAAIIGFCVGVLPLLGLVWNLSSKLTKFAAADEAQAAALDRLSGEVDRLRAELGKVAQIEVLRSRMNRMDEDLTGLRQAARRQGAALQRIVAHLEAKGARLGSTPDLDYEDVGPSRSGKED